MLKEINHTTFPIDPNYYQKANHSSLNIDLL